MRLFVFVTLLQLSLPAHAADYKYASINCRTSNLFLVPATKHLMLVDPSNVQVQPGGFLAVQGRRIVGQGIDDPELTSCSYEYHYLRSADLDIQPIDPDFNDRRPLPEPEPEPDPIPPCLFPGQYPYCLGAPLSADKSQLTGESRFEDDDTPFYEIRDFNAILLEFRAEESVITCHPGSTLDYVAGDNLIEPLVDMFVETYYSEELGRDIAGSRSQVNARQCLFLDEL